MKPWRLFLGAVLAAFAVTGCANRSDTILFLGDSITEAGYFVDDIQEAWRGQAGGGPERVVVRGVGGETVLGLTEPLFPGERPVVFSRLAGELRRHRPDWVVACYGMNCGLFLPFDEARFRAYQEGIERLIQDVQAAGAGLILLIPPPFNRPMRPEVNSAGPEDRLNRVAALHADARDKLAREPRRYGYFAPYQYYDEVLAVQADWLATMAGREGVWVVDMRSPLSEQREQAYDANDPVHPNRAGHRLMAEIFLRAWPEMTEDGRRKTEDRRPKTEDRRRMTDASRIPHPVSRIPHS